MVNLDKVVDICPFPERPWPDGTEPYNVVAFEPGMRLDDRDDPVNGRPAPHYLCECDDEEHGKAIIEQLAECIAAGRTVTPATLLKERVARRREGGDES